MIERRRRRCADGADVVPLLGIESGLEQEAGHADDAVHRCADPCDMDARNSDLERDAAVGLLLAGGELLLGLDAGGDVRWR